MDDYTNFFSTDQVRSSIAIKKKNCFRNTNNIPSSRNKQKRISQ